jgi:hypothetical protein
LTGVPESVEVFSDASITSENDIEIIDWEYGRALDLGQTQEHDCNRPGDGRTTEASPPVIQS